MWMHTSIRREQGEHCIRSVGRGRLGKWKSTKLPRARKVGK